jgi:hypothetical protein
MKLQRRGKQALAHPEWGGWNAGQQHPSKAKFKNIDFVTTMKSEVLHDFPFSRNLPQKSVDNYYMGILENITKT